ncbi:hypothetical protein T484DRAFT_1758502, partial [Baffinella frigidus]
MSASVSPPLVEALQRKTLASIPLFPHSAIPETMLFFAAVGGPRNLEHPGGRRILENPRLTDALLEAARGAAHLFSAHELPALLRAAAALGETTRFDGQISGTTRPPFDHCWSNFVEAMQERAMHTSRDLAPGGVVGLMCALAEMGE